MYMMMFVYALTVKLYTILVCLLLVSLPLRCCMLVHAYDDPLSDVYGEQMDRRCSYVPGDFMDMCTWM